MRYFMIGLLLAGMGPALATAQEIDTETRVTLQSAMLSHIDGVTSDGAYTYLDTTTDEIREVYPTNVHPMIVPIENGWFVCSEMVDNDGQTVTADFLVRQVGQDMRVVQMIVNDRGSLETMMSKAN